MGRLPPKGHPLFEKKDSYTPTEAKRAYDHLDRFVAEKTMSPRQAGVIAGTSLTTLGSR